MFVIKTSSLLANHHLQTSWQQDKTEDGLSQVTIKYQHYILTSAWTKSTVWLSPEN